MEATILRKANHEKIHRFTLLFFLLKADSAFSENLIPVPIELNGGCKIIFVVPDNRADAWKEVSGEWTGNCSKNNFLQGTGTATLHSKSSTWKSKITAHFAEGLEQGKGNFQTTKDGVEIEFSGTYENGQIKNGSWSKKTNKGILIYSGDFKNGKFDGEGILITRINQNKGNSTNYRIEGNFSNGEANGRGKYIWADGSYWVGNFSNGKLNGIGTQIHSNGSQEIIEYVDDKLGSANPGDGTEAHYWCAQYGYVYQTVDYAKCRGVFYDNQRLEKIQNESIERQNNILKEMQSKADHTSSRDSQLDEISRQQKILMKQQQEILEKQNNTKPGFDYKPISKDSPALKPQLFDIKTGKPIPN